MRSMRLGDVAAIAVTVLLLISEGLNGSIPGVAGEREKTGAADGGGAMEWHIEEFIGCISKQNS